MHLFYTPQIETDPNLPAEEAAHCIRVLRLQPGDPVLLTDGKGFFYKAALKEITKRAASVSVIEKIQWKKGWTGTVHLAVAPIKNLDRMEWFVEKATEIGMDECSFLQCMHSERKVLKLERLTKIAVSAMKQSLKAQLPVLNELQSFSEFVCQPREGRKFIAHCQDGEKPLLRQIITPGEPLTVLIGPEGDFSPEEVELALSKGFEAVSLGRSRLRTEMAALAAALLMNV